MKTLLTLCVALVAGAAGAQTTWYEIPTGTTKKLNTIDFPSPGVGYIGGNDSLLLKTTNGGETWTEVNYTGVTFLPGGDAIVKLDFVSATVGYMTTGPYSGIYKTTNGGTTWVEITPAGNLCYNYGLFFFDEQNGFVGGSGCFQGEVIEKMIDGVMTATTIEYPTWDAANQVVDIDFLNSSYGLAASVSGYMLRTTDGGSNWDTIPTGLPAGVPLTSVAVVNDTLAYAGYNDLGSGFGILRTVDGGLSWAQDMNSATFYYPAWLSVHYAVNGTVYAGTQPQLGESGVIFESNNNDVWAFYDVEQPIYGISSYGDSVVFAVGDSGYVVVNQPPVNLHISETEVQQPELIIYPNPVQNEITFELPAGIPLEETFLQVTNSAGQVVHQSTPLHNRVDMSRLTPGIYFVELTSAQGIFMAKVIKE